MKHARNERFALRASSFVLCAWRLRRFALALCACALCLRFALAFLLACGYYIRLWVKFLRLRFTALCIVQSQENYEFAVGTATQLLFSLPEERGRLNYRIPARFFLSLGGSVQPPSE